MRRAVEHNQSINNSNVGSERCLVKWVSVAVLWPIPDAKTVSKMDNFANIG